MSGMSSASSSGGLSDSDDLGTHCRWLVARFMSSSYESSGLGLTLLGLSASSS